MTIISPLDRAKEYLILPEGIPNITKRTENALIPAIQEFQEEYNLYLKVKNMAESFTSSQTEDIDGFFIWVTLEEKYIRRMYNYFRLRSETVDYEDDYEILQIDKSNNRIKIDTNGFQDGVQIVLENQELQLYNDALAWYICAFVTFTQQEIKACKVLVTSTQFGESSSEASSQMTIGKFREVLKNNGRRLLKTKHFPTIA